jgi:hypothetical protein
MKTIQFFLLTLLLSTIQLLHSQSQNKERSNPGDTLSKIIFEKLYLHFDRTSYSAGDDIWYKVYLADANTNRLISSDNCVHVELYSKDSKLVANEVIYLSNGTGYGDFILDESMAEGTYLIRAYTNWMRNFGDLFFYTKFIEILNPYSVNPNNNHNLGKNANTIDLQFMPEGGSLVTEVVSDVGFKATDRNGLGLKISGFVISSENDTVSEIKSIHNGMGKFTFIPKPGLSYYASAATEDGISISAHLPLAKKTGNILHIENADEKSIKVVVRTDKLRMINQSANIMYISAATRNNLCLLRKISIDTTLTTIFISKENFPEGITCFTLFNSDLIPQCERLFYIHKNDGVHIQFTFDKEEYLSREKSYLTIETTNSGHSPLMANLSLAVAQIDTQEEGNFGSDICSNFLLESDIRGIIENPGYYFDQDQPDRFKFLDLLLLTQGWRNFVWKLLPDSLSILNFPIETGFSVSGRLRQLIRNKAIPNATISMLILDSLSPPIIMFTTTDNEGKFHFDGLSYTGMRKIVLSACDEKNKQRGLLLLDSLNTQFALSYVPVSVESKFIVRGKENPSINDSVPHQDELKYLKRKKFSIRDTTAIDQVEVYAKKSHLSDDGRYRIYGGLPDHVIDSKDIHGAIGMDGFLMIASYEGGFRVSGSCSHGLYITSTSHRRPGRMLTLWNGIEVPSDFLCGFDPAEIEKIEVISNTIVFGTDVAGVVSIFTKENSRSRNDIPPYVVKKELEGFYKSRIFYSPEFDGKDIPDPRTRTIYWNPNILTDVNGQAKISFYNTNKPGVAQAQVEGISSDGIPISGKVKYRIK